MLLTLRVINEDATLNSYIVFKVFKFIAGSDISIIFELWQNDKQIRYIPSIADVITCDFLKSDGTVLTKTATYPFADDRSKIAFSLTDVESSAIISQNIVVKIQSGSNTTFAILQGGLQRVVPTQGC